MTAARPPKGPGRNVEGTNNTTAPHGAASAFAFRDPFAPSHEAPGWKGSRYGCSALRREIESLLLRASPGSRHEEVHRSACRMGQLVSDLNPEWAYVELVAAARQLGLPESAARRQVERGLRWGADHPRKPTPSPYLPTRHAARPRLVYLARAVLDPSLDPVARRVAFAFLAIAHRAGKVQIGISYRQLAGVAGTSVASVAAAVKGPLCHLVSVHRPWSPHDPDAANTATVWTIHPTPRRTAPPANRPEATPAGFARLYGGGADPVERVLGLPAWLRPGHDLWDDQSSAWAVMLVLWMSGEPLTAKELSDRAGISLRTTQRVLGRFGRVELVLRNRKGRTHLFSLSPDIEREIGNRTVELADLPPHILRASGPAGLRYLGRTGEQPPPRLDLAAARAWRRDEEARTGELLIVPVGELRRMQFEWERRRFRMSLRERIRASERVAA